MSSLEALNQILLPLAKWWMLASVALFLSGRSRNTSAATLHAILLFVLFSLCCLPWVQYVSAAVQIKLVPESLARISLPENWVKGFILGYGLIVAVIWMKFLWHLYKLRGLGNGSGPQASAQQWHLLQELQARMGIRRPVKLVCNEHINTPLTYGWWNPMIVLPQSSLHWDIHRLRRFLLHELTHVRRNDWLIKVFTRTLVSAFWILPSAWAMLKKIEWLAELACDDAVIRAEGARADYADDLLEMTAYGHSSEGAVALIEDYGHYDRIAAVLDGGRVRTSDPIKFWPYALVFTGMLLLLAVVRFGVATRPNASSFILMPLVVVTASESEPTAALPVVPSFPEKIPAEDIPFSELRLQVDALPEINAELESLAVAADFSSVIVKVEATHLKPLYMPLPEYPRRALKKNIEGRVTAEFDVLPDGSVHGVRILAAEPAKYFDQAVMAALKQYRYSPQPGVVKGLTEVFEFRLLEDAHSIPAAKK
jgi:bla regulator protein BlaR1